MLKSPPCAAPVATRRPLGLDAAGLVDEAGVAEGPRVPLAPRRAIPEVAPRLVAATGLLVVVEIACRSLPATPSPTTVTALAVAGTGVRVAALAVGPLRLGTARRVAKPQVTAVLAAALAPNAAIPKAGLKGIDPLLRRDAPKVQVPNTEPATRRFAEARVETRSAVVEVRPSALERPVVVAPIIDARMLQLLPVRRQLLVR